MVEILLAAGSDLFGLRGTFCLYNVAEGTLLHQLLESSAIG